MINEITNREAEQSVIGSIVFEPNILPKVQRWLEPEHFWYKEHRELYEIILNLKKNHIPIDTITILDKVKSCKYAKPTTLSDCIATVISSENVEYHAKIVLEKYIQRRLAETTAELYKKGTQNYDPKLLDEHERLIRELRNLKPKIYKKIEDIVEDTKESILNKNNIIHFGIRALDDFAGGMTRGEITVIGGRPSHGKSTTVVNLAKSLIEQGYKVIIFNREMTNVEMAKKLLVLESKLLYANVRSQMLSDLEIKEMEATFEIMKSKYQNLFMYDNIKTLPEALAEIKTINPDVVIDDYIQKIIMPNNKDRRFQLEEIMNEYSWAIKEINASAILVSQLNREIEKRISDPRPRMSDFAESGAIEQVAENAIFVFRGYVFDPEAYDKYELELIVAKARYGEPATYKIGFNGNRCKLYSTKEDASLGG